MATTASTRLPAGIDSDSTTPTRDPMTHISCSRVSKRAKALPWSDSRTWRWTSASKDGLATAPAAPTATATSTWRAGVANTHPSRPAAVTNQSAAVSICCSDSSRRRRPTRSTPTTAPTVSAPISSPYHQAAAFSRRSPKAKRKVRKPSRPLSTDIGVSARMTWVPAMGRKAARSRCSSTHQSSTSGDHCTSAVGSAAARDRPPARVPPADRATRAAFRTGSRRPATTAATNTTPHDTSTAGEPASLRMATAGSAKTNPDSEASSPRRALRVARSGSTTSRPVTGSSTWTVGGVPYGGVGSGPRAVGSPASVSAAGGPGSAPASAISRAAISGTSAPLVTR